MRLLISLTTLLTVCRLVVTTANTAATATTTTNAVLADSSDIQFRYGLPYLYPNYERRFQTIYPQTIEQYYPQYGYPNQRYPNNNNNYYPNQRYPNNNNNNNNYYPHNGGNNYYPNNHQHPHRRPHYGSWYPYSPLSSDQYTTILVTRPVTELSPQTKTLPAQFDELPFDELPRGARNMEKNLPREDGMVRKDSVDDNDSGGISASAIVPSVDFEPKRSKPLPVAPVVTKPNVRLVESSQSTPPQHSRPVSFALVPIVEQHPAKPEETKHPAVHLKNHDHHKHPAVHPETYDHPKHPDYPVPPYQASHGHVRYPDLSASGLGQQYPVMAQSAEVPAPPMVQSGSTFTNFRPTFYRLVHQPVVAFAPPPFTPPTNDRVDYDQMSPVMMSGQIGDGGGYTSSSYSHDFMPKNGMKDSPVTQQKQQQQQQHKQQDNHSIRNDSPVSPSSDSHEKPAKNSNNNKKKPTSHKSVEDKKVTEDKDNKVVSQMTQDSRPEGQINHFQPDLGQFSSSVNTDDNNNRDERKFKS